MRRLAMRHRRGQAAVELAVTMIVLLPLLFYTLFLEDLLVYNLEWQEAIVVSPWDALPLDYAKSGGDPDPAGNPMRLNRKVYCDHTAAYDSFTSSYDCADQVHHQAMTAHQCWLVQDGKQVTCSLDKSIGRDIEEDYAGKFNKGGMVSCTARLGVMNYFIPQTIFSKFGNGKVEVTRTTRYTGSADTNAHANSKQSGVANAWVFGYQGGGSGSPAVTGSEEEDGVPEDPSGAGTGGSPNEDYFGVVHDSWAANTVPDVDPSDHPSDHEIYRGMAHFYDNDLKVTLAVAEGVKFGGKLTGSEKLLSAAALSEETLGDDLSSPNMAFKETDNSRDTNSKYASGYNDSRQKDTYGDRVDEYMGMPKSTW